MLPGLAEEEISVSSRNNNSQVTDFIKDHNYENNNLFNKTLFQKINLIREEQEKLVQYHFDFCMQQETNPSNLSDAQLNSENHIKTLMEKVSNVSNSLYQLSDFDQ